MSLFVEDGGLKLSHHKLSSSSKINDEEEDINDFISKNIMSHNVLRQEKTIEDIVLFNGEISELDSVALPDELHNDILDFISDSNDFLLKNGEFILSFC